MLLAPLLSRSGLALFCSGIAIGATALYCYSSFSRRRDEGEDSGTEEEDEDDEQQARQLRLRGTSVRDDYGGDETYKMLLIFNMELYKLSSKTGEMKAVKMSPGKAPGYQTEAQKVLRMPK